MDTDPLIEELAGGDNPEDDEGGNSPTEQEIRDILLNDSDDDDDDNENASVDSDDSFRTTDGSGSSFENPFDLSPSDDDSRALQALSDRWFS
ncbi:hypothetical protein KUCAC02_022063 [Chaenocephalus aceratus]|nr:hypothetical protein KUCAC02_022063 [Chaenocephalus aceratus]